MSPSTPRRQRAIALHTRPVRTDGREAPWDWANTSLHFRSALLAAGAAVSVADGGLVGCVELAAAETRA